MIPIATFLWPVATVINRIPPVLKLLPSMRNRLLDMRIVTPSPADAVESSPFKVSGTCNYRPAGNWILLTKSGELYWPQSKVEFDLSGRTWTGSVHFDMSNDKASTVVIAEVSPELQHLINYFRAVGAKTGHQPINIPDGSTGLAVFHEVILHKRQFAETAP